MKIRKIIKISLLAAAIVCAILIVNFIPAWNLETRHMQVYEGERVNVHYEREAAAASDVFALAQDRAAGLSDKLGISSDKKINIYIYDHQSAMQTKKYGFIAPLLGLDWYIGDNIGTNVLLTSPANPGKVHNYNNNKYAVLHEMVHAYISELNPHISLWLTEGTALYLTNGEPFYKEYLSRHKIPSLSAIKTTNPVKFANIGGYQLANTYIEYLDAAYGWDKVLELIRTENYKKSLGKTQQRIYAEWIAYLENYRQ